MRLYQPLLPYGVAIASTAIALLLTLWLQPWLTQSIGAFFFVAIAITTGYGRLLPGVVAILLSSLEINAFFVSPLGQWLDLSPSGLLRFSTFGLVAVVVHGLSDRLRHQQRRLQHLSQQLLEESADRLHLALKDTQDSKELLQQQFEQQRLVMEISQRIRQSLHLHDILQTTVDEVRQFLQVDRVIIFQFGEDWSGRVMVESVQDGSLSILPFDIYDPCIGEKYVEPFRQGFVTAKDDIYTAKIATCHVEFLSQFQVRANLVVPILKYDQLWGLLAAHHCTAARPWQTAEIDLLKQISAQVSIALQQAALFEQVQTEQVALKALNAELEARVTERTAELQRAHDLLDNFFNAASSASIGLCIHNQNLEYIRINEALAAINGYSVEAHLGQTVADLLPDLSTLINPLLRQVLATRQPILNVEVAAILPSKPGATRYWLISYFPILERFGREETVGVGVIVIEISDRKQSELALQQQTRQKQLLWNITQAIRQSLNLEAILSTAVTEMHQILNLDRAAVYRFLPDWSGDFVVEAVAEGWERLVDPQVQRVWEDTYLQEHQGGRFRNHETLTVADIYDAQLQPCHIDLLEQFQARAYAIAPIFVGQSLWGLFALYQNAAPYEWQTWEVELLQQIASQLAIAIQQAELYSQVETELQERKQAEAVLREAERRWRSLLDNVQLLVVGLDQEGTVTYVNPFFLSLTGYSDTDVLGQNWVKTVLPPSSQEMVQTIFSGVLTENAHPYYQDYILTKSGEERFIAWNNTRLQDSAGHVTGMVSIGEDITEQQKVEELKNEFIGIVSHELRTPLTAIQMSLGLLKTGIYANRPEKAQRMIEIALTDTNRLVNLVNDILDLERLESGRALMEKTICRAADLIRQAVDGMQAIASQQHITVAIAPTDATVWASADAIIQTLTNLLSNAIKFSPPHSVIHLQAEPQGDHVLFEVRDQGRGIPGDMLEVIFGRFQQVDASDSREKGGTGLGLPICRSILERHGGKIWAESTLGQGSTFYFTLPLPPSHTL